MSDPKGYRKIILAILEFEERHHVRISHVWTKREHPALGSGHLSSIQVELETEPFFLKEERRNDR